MTREDREKAASELREFYDSAVLRTSLRRVALEVGVSHTTLADFIGGEVPSQRSLQLLQTWRNEQVHMIGEIRESGPPYGDRSDLVDKIISRFEPADMMRRMAGKIPARDLWVMALDAALERQASDDEIDQLNQWGKELVAREKNGN